MEGKWIVKVAVLGNQLYKGCAAFTSKVKRQSRAATQPKKALIMKYLGVFNTQVEAELAYDDATRSEAIRMQVPVSRMPARRVVERSCGKHFAIESKGYNDSVCEECVVRSFNGGGGGINAAFMYNGINYLLKMLTDTHFLGSCEPLQLWLGKKFPLRRNPFILYHNLQDYQPVREAQMEAYRHEQTSLTDDVGNARDHGGAGNSRFASRGGRHAGGPPLRAIPPPSQKSLQPRKDENPELGAARLRGLAFGIPGTRLLEHTGPKGERVVEWMGHMSSKSGDTMAVGADRAFVKGHYSSGATVSITQVDQLIQEHGGKNVELLGMPRVIEGVQLLLQEEELARMMTDDGGGSGGTGASAPSSVAARMAKAAAGRAGGAGIDGGGNVDEGDNEDDLDAREQNMESAMVAAVKKHKEDKKKKGQLDIRPPQPTEKTVFFMDGGVKMGIRQPRVPDPSYKQDIWMNPDEGPWKLCFDGRNFTNNGFTVRGKETQHNMFELLLRREGEARIGLRQRVQRELSRALRRPDSLDPSLLLQIIAFGRELRGSLLLMDCDKAETVMRRWQHRTGMSIRLQRCYRGHVGRMEARIIRRQRMMHCLFHREKELLCATLARELVPDIVQKGVRLAARQIVTKPVMTKSCSMEGESCSMTFFSAAHKDYKYREKARPAFWGLPFTAPCRGCMRWKPRKMWDMSQQRIVAYNAPCSCVTVREPERIVVRTYTQRTGETHEVVVSETDMRDRLLDQQLRRGWDTNTLVARACRLERLPTDYTLRMNIGVARRQRFEPLEEAQTALRRAAAARRLAQTADDEAAGAANNLNGAAFIANRRRQEADRGEQIFRQRHRLMLRMQMQVQAMLVSSDKAMFFVRHQLEVYKNMEDSTSQQSYDPLQNANDHVWIKRKYEAKKRLVVVSKARDDARYSLVRLRMILHDAVKNVAAMKVRLVQVEESAARVRAHSQRIINETKIVVAMRDEVMHRLSGMLALRWTNRVPVMRRLVFREYEWDVKLPAMRLQPLVLRGWDCRFKRGMGFTQQNFMDYARLSRRLFVTILEDPASDTDRAPNIGTLLIRGYDPATSRTETIEVHAADLWDLFRHRKPELFATLEESADTHIVCRTPGCHERLRSRRRLLSSRSSEKALQLFPHAGLGLGEDHHGGPVLRCPVCSAAQWVNRAAFHHPATGRTVPGSKAIVAAEAAATEAAATTGTRLLEEASATGPAPGGSPVRSVRDVGVVSKSDDCDVDETKGPTPGGVGDGNADGNVEGEQRKPVCDAVAPWQGRQPGLLPASGTIKRHGGYAHRRALFEWRRQSVLQAVIDDLALGRVHCGLVLGRLEFLRIKRMINKRLCRTQWAKDVRAGRTSGKGSLVFSEGRKVGGAYMYITVHENYGDLTVEVYRPRTAEKANVFITADVVLGALQAQPQWADYWLASVRSNTYSQDLMRHICDHLDLIDTDPPHPEEFTGVRRFDTELPPHTNSRRWRVDGHRRRLQEQRALVRRRNEASGGAAIADVVILKSGRRRRDGEALTKFTRHHDDDIEVAGTGETRVMDVENRSTRALVLRTVARGMFKAVLRESCVVSGRQCTVTVLQSSRCEYIIELHDPLSAQNHSLQLDRTALRRVLRSAPSLLKVHDEVLWRHLASLAALRPDPAGGRMAHLRLRLDQSFDELRAQDLALEQASMEAEDALAKALLAEGRYNRKSDARAASIAVVAMDSGTAATEHVPLPLALRMAGHARTMVTAGTGTAVIVSGAGAGANADVDGTNALLLLRDMLHGWVESRETILTAARDVLAQLQGKRNDAAVRIFDVNILKAFAVREVGRVQRALAEMTRKSGMRLVLSSARPEEHWRPVWLTPMAFNATPAGMHTGGRLRGKQLTHGWVEVLKKKRQLWIRARRETESEQVARREAEERRQMSCEEVYRRRADLAIVNMRELTRRARQAAALRAVFERKAALVRQARPRQENAALFRLRRLSRVARRLAAEVFFCWPDDESTESLEPWLEPRVAWAGDGERSRRIGRDDPFAGVRQLGLGNGVVEPTSLELGDLARMVEAEGDALDTARSQVCGSRPTTHGGPWPSTVANAATTLPAAAAIALAAAVVAPEAPETTKRLLGSTTVNMYGEVMETLQFRRDRWVGREDGMKGPASRGVSNDLGDLLDAGGGSLPWERPHNPFEGVAGGAGMNFGDSMYCSVREMLAYRAPRPRQACEKWEKRKIVSVVNFSANMYAEVSQGLRFRAAQDDELARITKDTWGRTLNDRRHAIRMGTIDRRGTTTTGLVALASALAAHETFGNNMYGWTYGQLGFHRRTPYIKQQALELRQRAAQRGTLREMRLTYLREMTTRPANAGCGGAAGAAGAAGGTASVALKPESTVETPNDTYIESKEGTDGSTDETKSHVTGDGTRFSDETRTRDGRAPGVPPRASGALAIAVVPRVSGASTISTATAIAVSAGLALMPAEASAQLCLPRQLHYWVQKPQIPSASQYGGTLSGDGHAATSDDSAAFVREDVGEDGASGNGGNPQEEERSILPPVLRCPRPRSEHTKGVVTCRGLDLVAAMPSKITCVLEVPPPPAVMDCLAGDTAGGRWHPGPPGSARRWEAGIGCTLLRKDQGGGRKQRKKRRDRRFKVPFPVHGPRQFDANGGVTWEEEGRLVEDCRALGKVFVRTVRKIRGVYTILTVQGVPSERQNITSMSAQGISAVLRVEAYVPSTGKAHVLVVDVDDMKGKRWARHLELNECAVSLARRVRVNTTTNYAEAHGTVSAVGCGVTVNDAKVEAGWVGAPARRQQQQKQEQHSQSSTKRVLAVTLPLGISCLTGGQAEAAFGKRSNAGATSFAAGYAGGAGAGHQDGDFIDATVGTRVGPRPMFREVITRGSRRLVLTVWRRERLPTSSRLGQRPVSSTDMDCGGALFEVYDPELEISGYVMLTDVALRACSDIGPLQALGLDSASTTVNNEYPLASAEPLITAAMREAAQKAWQATSETTTTSNSRDMIKNADNTPQDLASAAANLASHRVLESLQLAHPSTARTDEARRARLRLRRQEELQALQRSPRSRLQCHTDALRVIGTAPVVASETSFQCAAWYLRQFLVRTRPGLLDDGDTAYGEKGTLATSRRATRIKALAPAGLTAAFAVLISDAGVERAHKCMVAAAKCRRLRNAAALMMQQPVRCYMAKLAVKRRKKERKEMRAVSWSQAEPDAYGEVYHYNSATAESIGDVQRAQAWTLDPLVEDSATDWPAYKAWVNTATGERLRASSNPANEVRFWETQYGEDGSAFFFNYATEASEYSLPEYIQETEEEHADRERSASGIAVPTDAAGTPSSSTSASAASAASIVATTLQVENVHPPPPVSTAAADEWTEEFDEETSAAYYYNHETGASVTDDPRPALRAAAAAASAAIGATGAAGATLGNTDIGGEDTEKGVAQGASAHLPFRAGAFKSALAQRPRSRATIRDRKDSQSCASDDGRVLDMHGQASALDIFERDLDDPTEASSDEANTDGGSNVQKVPDDPPASDGDRDGGSFHGVFIPSLAELPVQVLNLSSTSWQIEVTTRLGVPGKGAAGRKISRKLLGTSHSSGTSVNMGGAAVFYAPSDMGNARLSVLVGSSLTGDAVWVKQGATARSAVARIVAADKAARVLPSTVSADSVDAGDEDEVFSGEEDTAVAEHICSGGSDRPSSTVMSVADAPPTAEELESKEDGLISGGLTASTVAAVSAASVASTASHASTRRRSKRVLARWRKANNERRKMRRACRTTLHKELINEVLRPSAHPANHLPGGTALCALEGAWAPLPDDATRLPANRLRHSRRGQFDRYGVMGAGGFGGGTGMPSWLMDEGSADDDSNSEESDCESSGSADSLEEQPLLTGTAARVRERYGRSGLLTEFRQTKTLAIASLQVDAEEVEVLASCQSLVSPLNAASASPWLGLGSLRDSDMQPGGRILRWLMDRLVYRRGTESDGSSDTIALDRTVLRIGRRMPPDGVHLMLTAECQAGMPETLLVHGHDPVTRRGYNLEITKSVLRAVRDTCIAEAQSRESAMIISGADRHRNMYAVALRVCQDLVVMERNKVPTLAHDQERWVREALAQREQIASLRAEIHARRRRKRALNSALSTLVRRKRLNRYREKVEARRRRRQAREMLPMTQEWARMVMEDKHASVLRPYLSASWTAIVKVKDAFDIFDKDNSGTIYAKEFQQLAFEFGEVLDDKQVKEALSEVDMDGSGELEFHEFALWWLGHSHNAKHGFRMNLLKKSLQLRQKMRQARSSISHRGMVAKQYAQHARRRMGGAWAEIAKRQEKKRRTQRRHAALHIPVIDPARMQRFAAKKGAMPEQAALAPGEMPSVLPGSNMNRWKRRRYKARRVLLSPYLLPRDAIVGRLQKRAKKRQRELEHAEASAAAAKLMKDEAKENLRKRLAEEKILEQNKAEAKENELKDARKAAIAIAEKQRKEAEQKKIDEEAAAEKKKLDEILERRKAKAAKEKAEEEEKAKREDLLLLQRENKAEYDRTMAVQAEKERKLKEEADAKALAAKRVKAELVQKQMEEKFAKMKEAEKGNSKDAKKAEAKKADKEREMRLKKQKRRMKQKAKK
jgi:hypothetical protein